MSKKWIWRGEEDDPPNHITKEEVQEMIDEAVDRAINQHNRNAMYMLIKTIVIFGSITSLVVWGLNNAYPITGNL